VKQVIQSFKTGELTVADVPPPILRPQGLLVRNAVSLVSAGTERMLVDFAEKNLLQKARERPDLVRQVLDKAQREGIVNTIDSVRNRLDQPLALGYSTAGLVVDVGSRAGGFQVGDRVACAGGNYASHAEMSYIPRTLAVKLPANVSYEAGAFATVGAIALQGIRQAEVVIGHKVAVIGLGLLGQLTVQMLRAAGCQVLGIDISSDRVDLARQMDANDACLNEHAHDKAQAFTDGYGFDAVIITAATKTNELVELAGELGRDRAIIVAVGAFGMDLPRKVYYEKELDFRLSRSYGPGRYDPEYEDKGHDYPYGYVRWTEQRNMEAFLQLVADGSVKVEPLITHRYAIEDADRAYDLITGKIQERFLGVLLTYDVEKELTTHVTIQPPTQTQSPQSIVRVGVVGAGNFTNATLLPAMSDVQDLEFVGIMSGSGMTARTTGDRFGFAYCTSDYEDLLRDPQINWIVIATRHNLHAEQTLAALKAGKHAFVEKPLTLNREELLTVARAQQETGQRLMVGFNRRFAPLVQQMRNFLVGHSRPLVGIYRINSGTIPRSHWTQDLSVGGGRIIGEACHFIDLLQYLVGAPPVLVHAMAIQDKQGLVDDEAIITLSFEDGSVGTVIYAAGGDKSFGKERVEIIGDSRVAVLDNFTQLELIRNGKKTRKLERFRSSKGHREEWETLVRAAKSGSDTPIPIQEIVAAHLASFAAMESLRSAQSVQVDLPGFWADLRERSGIE